MTHPIDKKRYSSVLSGQDINALQGFGLDVPEPGNENQYLGAVQLRDGSVIEVYAMFQLEVFWTFVIYNREQGRVFEIKTASGQFLEFWKTAQYLAEGRIEVEMRSLSALKCHVKEPTYGDISRQGYII